MRMKPIILGLTLCLLLSAIAVAAAPVSPAISLQGKLTDAKGYPLSGSYNFQFKIFDVASGGTALWTSGVQSVPVSKGIWQTSISTPDTVDFNRSLWLEVTVGTEILSPRSQLMFSSLSYASSRLLPTTWDIITSGKIGIGTDNAANTPTSKLTFGGGSGGWAIAFQNDAARVYTTFGSAYSSANAFIGHAVRSKTTAAGYEKSASWDMAQSLIDVGGDIRFATKASDADPQGTNWDLVGNTKMIIKNDGKIGIGTSSPGARLDISGGYATTGLVSPAGLGIAAGGASPDRAQIFWGDNTGWKLHFGTKDSGGAFQSRVTFMDTGNVGIGTTTPKTKLHLLVPDDGGIRIQAGESGWGAARLEFYSDPIDSSTEWRPGYITSNDSGSFTGRLDFYTNGAGSGSKTGSVLGMSVINGRVGVGTTSPIDALQVGDGGTKFGAGVAGSGASLGYGTSYVGFNAVRNSSGFVFDTDSVSNGGALIYSTVFGNLRFVTVESTGGTDKIVTDSDILNNKIRMQIDPNGNVRAYANVYVSNDLDANRVCINGDCKSSWPGGVGGSGTTNRVAKWTGTGSLGDSKITDDGTIVTVASSVRGNQVGALRIDTGNGYVDIGPQNSGWAHINTDRNRFYFNKGITVDSGNIGSYSQDLNLQTSGTTRMTILNSNGNVGIGTASPATKLDVEGPLVSGRGQLYVSSTSGHGYVVVDSQNANEAGYIIENAGAIKWYIYRPGGTNDLAIYDSTTSTNKLYIKGGLYGNIGIGKNDPGYSKLDVYQNVDYAGAINATAMGSGAGSYAVEANAPNFVGVSGKGGTAGVVGYSLNGNGIFGSSSNGWAGYFDRGVRITQFGNLSVGPLAVWDSGRITSVTGSDYGFAISGIAEDGGNVGVLGEYGECSTYPSDGVGVFACAENGGANGAAIRALATGSTAWAGWFNGKVKIDSDLYVGGSLTSTGAIKTSSNLKTTYGIMLEPAKTCTAPAGKTCRALGGGMLYDCGGTGLGGGHWIGTLCNIGTGRSCLASISNADSSEGASTDQIDYVRCMYNSATGNVDGDIDNRNGGRSQSLNCTVVCVS